jgi:predicted GNAT family acetyltransferase
MKINTKHGELEYVIVKRKVYRLKRCFVESQHRRRGIAKCLIEQFLKTHDGDIYADVIQGDSIIIKLLKSYGFSKIGKSKIYTNCDEYMLRRGSYSRHILDTKQKSDALNLL